MSAARPPLPKIASAGKGRTLPLELSFILNTSVPPPVYRLTVAHLALCALIWIQYETD